MDARLLNPEEYQVKAAPASSFQMPQAPPAPLNDPAAFQVHPGPVGAKYLAEPEAPQAPPMAAPQSAAPPAAALAEQPQQAAPSNPWTDERKKFAAKVNQTARQYGEMVKSRRLQRAGMKEYSKLKNQLDAAASKYADLQELEKQYPALYGQQEGGEPNPHAIALQRQQAKHLQEASRLRETLNSRAKDLSKRFGWALDKNGGLKDEDSLTDQGDQQFDDVIRRGYLDALSTQPVE